MTVARWTVGVDFGGTNVKVGLVTATGRVAAVTQLSSTVVGRPSSFVEGVAGAIEALARGVGSRATALRGVGVGAPGCVDVSRGIVHSVVNLSGWHEVPLRRLLERRLRCRCIVDNDVNLFTLGEWRFGAGRGAHHLLGLTLGTGVGGGLILNGSLYRGPTGSAGEVGHTVIERRGPRCACGRRGCLEALVGTAAIVRLARRAIRHGAEPLTTLVHRAGGKVVPRLVGRAGRAGDRLAKEVWVQVGRRLGIGLANFVNLLNLERIVIGGGIANNWTLFAPTLMRTIRTEAMGVPARTVHVVRAQLGDHAGIVGGAVLLWSTIGRGGRQARR